MAVFNSNSKKFSESLTSEDIKKELAKQILTTIQ